MELRPFLRKWIIPIIWIIASFLVSFILANYIYPEVETENKLFGLKKINHYSFNTRLFAISASLSLGSLALVLALRLIAPLKVATKWLTDQIFVSQWFILILTITSGFFYVLGLTKELFVLEQFFFVDKEVTLLNSIRMLFENDENFLGTIIFAFTIVFPIFKYLLLIFSLFLNQKEAITKVNRWMSVISKWSMLDVYIVALLLLNMKFDSRLVNMELKEGVVWFSLSVILIMLAMLIQGRSRSVQLN